MDLVILVYKATQGFPRDEVFGLSSQLRRAASAVPSNIAEGDGRFAPRDQRRFFVQARGSLHEVETELLIAERLKYLREPKASELLELTSVVQRLLNRLIQSIRCPD